MSRIEPVTGCSAGPTARLAGLVTRLRYGRRLDSVGVFAWHPRLLRRYHAYIRAVERDDVLSQRLKSLAVLKVATVAECEFCMDMVSELGRRAGLTDEQLLALHRPWESGLFTREELLVLDFAAGLSRTPPEASDEVVSRLRDALGHKGLLELTHAVALENACGRIHAALGIGPEGFSEGRVRVAPEATAFAQVGAAGA